MLSCFVPTPPRRPPPRPASQRGHFRAQRPLLRSPPLVRGAPWRRSLAEDSPPLLALSRRDEPARAAAGPKVKVAGKECCCDCCLDWPRNRCGNRYSGCLCPPFHCTCVECPACHTWRVAAATSQHARQRARGLRNLDWPTRLANVVVPPLACAKQACCVECCCCSEERLFMNGDLKPLTWGQHLAAAQGFVR